ncbi:MAG: WYL domain-containing protein [Clostridia bacterium]|nr:WYL domain-containing protein [Clostridia bacterium]
MKDKGYTKLKLLYIKDYLEKNSDEEHPVSVEILMDMLDEKGITCERKSVYSDVKALKEYGVDIATVKKPFNGYAVLSRDFELPEIRLLIDAVQAADFISPKKTRELIDKMGSLCSAFQSKSLHKQVYIDNRVKCANEEIYYNIDVVSRAIQQRKKINFIYYKRKLNDGEKVIISDEKEFTVSPYALIWSNDHYYLVSNNEKYDNLMHTRIDRMKKVHITEEKARDFSEVSEYKNYFDVADYSSKSFNMYSGDTQRLVISCDNSILEEIIDRFGDEGIRADKDESRFVLSARCVVSEGLASWLMQFGSKVKVMEPKNLRDDIKKKAEEIVRNYE